MEARSRNHYCRGKAISSRYYERVCILALLIGHANRILCAPFDICKKASRSARINISKVILYLHRALNKVTQSANQHMHTFNFFIY